nr:hypothetical protein [Gemmatimonadaceae bacterium]
MGQAVPWAAQTVARWATVLGLAAVSLLASLLFGGPLLAQRDVVRGPRGDSAVLSALEAEGAQRLTAGRFTVVAFPSEARLARALLDAAQARDTFPGLPRPRASVLIAVAPDEERFRAWAGPSAPAWGAAVAFPTRQRIVMQGQRAGSDAGSPTVTLRHELAHL